MSKRKVINWTIGTCFIAINVIGIGLSHQRRRAEAIMQQRIDAWHGQQAHALAAWNSYDPISIESKTCLRAIRQLGKSEVLQSPVPANELAWEDLSKGDANDLARAVHGLMLAYRRGGVQHLMKYMESREEFLAENHVKKLRRFMVKEHGFHEKELGQLDLEEQLSMYWDVYEVTSAWKGFVPEDSGIRIWQSESASPESLSEAAQLSTADMNLWKRRTACRHNFANSTDSLASHLQTHPNVRFADVRLVIEHAGKSMRTICPYVVRFWYSAEREKWIPHLFAQYSTSQDIPSTMLF